MRELLVGSWPGGLTFPGGGVCDGGAERHLIFEVVGETQGLHRTRTPAEPEEQLRGVYGEAGATTASSRRGQQLSGEQHRAPAARELPGNDGQPAELRVKVVDGDIGGGVLARDVEPAREGAAGVVPTHGFGREDEVAADVGEADAELDVLGSREGLVEPARCKEVRAADEGVAREELPPGGFVAAILHTPVLAFESAGFPEIPGRWLPIGRGAERAEDYAAGCAIDGRHEAFEAVRRGIDVVVEEGKVVGGGSGNTEVSGRGGAAVRIDADDAYRARSRGGAEDRGRNRRRTGIVHHDDAETVDCLVREGGKGLREAVMAVVCGDDDIDGGGHEAGSPAGGVSGVRNANARSAARGTALRETTNARSTRA